MQIKVLKILQIYEDNLYLSRSAGLEKRTSLMNS